ncbi:MAG: hypothetical protein ACRERE_25575 [Candidatus Entotheonellia bacterium]
MLNSWSWSDLRDQRRHVMALTALVGAILLLGLFCHHPEALGFATGHTHSGQPGVEHCWTSISNVPTLDFTPILVTLPSLTLTLKGCSLIESLFKPPRAFPPIRGWLICP